jgi:hypothetical protein
MKIKMFFLYLTPLLFIVGCQKLERDNPLDKNNPNYVPPPLGSVNNPAPALEYSRFEIFGDNNTDKVVNKGETIKLKVFVKNKGNGSSQNVIGTISCSNSYITITSTATSVKYSYMSSTAGIDPGNEGYPKFEDLLVFNVATTAPDNEVVTFSLNLNDANANSWTDTFNLQVKKVSALIEYHHLEVYADDNFNKLVDPGETIKLKVYLKNNGTSRVNKVRVTTTCTNPNVSSLTPTVPTLYSYLGTTSYDYIDKNQEAYASGVSNYPTFKISSGAPPGEVLVFNVSIVDEMGNTWQDSYSVNVN